STGLVSAAVKPDILRRVCLMLRLRALPQGSLKVVKINKRLAASAPVPGPIAGAGLPGLILANGGCSPSILTPIGCSSGTSLTFPQVAKWPILRSEPFSLRLATGQRSRNCCGCLRASKGLRGRSQEELTIGRGLCGLSCGGCGSGPWFSDTWWGGCSASRHLNSFELIQTSH